MFNISKYNSTEKHNRDYISTSEHKNAVKDKLKSGNILYMQLKCYINECFYFIFENILINDRKFILRLRHFNESIYMMARDIGTIR